MATETAADTLSGQSSSTTGSDCTDRARYFDSGTAFDLKLAPVPRHQFVAERDRAFGSDTPTGLIDMDLSDMLGTTFPATTPLVLSRYVRLQAGESLATELTATGEIYCVLTGHGETTNAADAIAWREGDVFCLPGGGSTVHRAGSDDAVLWLVTDEPLLAFTHAAAPAVGEAAVEAVHYPVADIQRQLDGLYERPADPEMAGMAIVFSSRRLEHQRNIMPSLTLALNSLAPGTSQRAHRHNSMALTLCLQGEGCYSLIEGQRIDWQQHAVMVTPPADVHSHHNTGRDRMQCLIVQDGGLHYHCRTMGFQYEEPAA